VFCGYAGLIANKWGSFAKEAYDFKEPTNRSHHISVSRPLYRSLFCGYAGLIADKWGSFADKQGSLVDI